MAVGKMHRHAFEQQYIFASFCMNNTRRKRGIFVANYSCRERGRSMTIESLPITVEIPREGWRLFCQRLSLHRGAMLDVAIHFASSERQLARDVPLCGIILDDFGEPDLLFVKFGPPSRVPLQHRVVAPARFILRRDGVDYGYGRLEIPGEYGMTVVSFRPGIHPALLEGLTPPSHTPVQFDRLALVN
jgi:hypothetical protein